MKQDTDKAVAYLKSRAAEMRSETSKLFPPGGAAARNAEDTKRSIDGITGAALKAVAVMGTVELGLGSISVGTAALSGDFEKAAEGLERLPAGIGPVASKTKEVLGIVTGIANDIARINAENAAMTAAIEAQATAAAKVRDIERDRLKTMRETTQQIELLRASEEDRAGIARRFAADNVVTAAQEKLDAAMRRPNIDSATRKQLDALREQADSLSGSGGFLSASLRFVGKHGHYGGAAGMLAKETIKATGAGDRSEDHAAAQRIRKQITLIHEAATKSRDAEIAALRDGVEQAKKLREEMLADQKRGLQRGVEATKKAEKEKLVATRDAENAAALDRMKVLKERVEASRRERQAELDAAVSQAGKEARLAMTLQTMRMRAGGDSLLADIADVENTYNTTESSSGAEAALRRGIRDQKILNRIRGAEKQLRGSVGGSSISALSSAIGSLQSQVLKREDPSLQILRDQLEVAKETHRAILDQADSGNIAVVN